MSTPIDDRAPREIIDDVVGCREAELRQLLAGCQERLLAIRAIAASPMSGGLRAHLEAIERIAVGTIAWIHRGDTGMAGPGAAEDRRIARPSQMRIPRSWPPGAPSETKNIRDRSSSDT